LTKIIHCRLAAYYHSENGFICGGSLISTKLVITAAHCVHYKNELAKKAEEATFYLGKHNIDSLSEQYNVVSSVTKFIVHPDWDSNDDRYDADIVIAVLTRTISFNKFIIPICLWTSTSNANDLFGKTGVITGWGKTEVDTTSPTPKWAEIPVVDLLTCIRSNNAFNKLTSDRTFCAGNRHKGSGPCMGDSGNKTDGKLLETFCKFVETISGGGFVAKVNDKWYLRGVVSSSLIDPENSCDTKNFAVFTDVSKFTQWIQRFVQTHG
jgi:secreted trypsin-like serine protease